MKKENIYAAIKQIERMKKENIYAQADVKSQKTRKKNIPKEEGSNVSILCLNHDSTI
jgi:hypothetical protein